MQYWSRKGNVATKAKNVSAVMYEENWAWKPSLRNNFQFKTYLQPCSKRAPHYQDPPSPSGAFELSPKKINLRCFLLFLCDCVPCLYGLSALTPCSHQGSEMLNERDEQARERD